MRTPIRYLVVAGRRLRRVLLPPAEAGLPDGARLSFATHGEDLILQELLLRMHHRVEIGFYVDVGAFHPWQFSNTADLYRRGWSGIAVEPNPYMAALFRDERPRDVVVEAAISSRSGSGTLYSFGEWASSSTLDPQWAESVTRTQGVEVAEERTVATLTLVDLFERYLPEGRGIDFLSVDVEGLDLAVLESNDWTRFRPVVVAVEEYEMDLQNPGASLVNRLLVPHGYRLVIRAVLTNFYVLDPAAATPVSI